MLWEQYRQDKDNLALMGQILREMPIYSLGLTLSIGCGKVARSRGKVISNLLERWKPREEMINEKDFGIIVLYCKKWEEKTTQWNS